MASMKRWRESDRSLRAISRAGMERLFVDFEKKETIGAGMSANMGK
jgi:hypothetical protein